MADTIETGVSELRPESVRRSVAGGLAALRRRLAKSKLLVSLAVVIVATVVPAIAIHYIPFLLYVEYFAQDIRTSVYMRPEEQDKNIVIVALDEDTLKRFPYSEPVDRALLAKIIATSVAHGARAIALDVLLDTPTE